MNIRATLAVAAAAGVVSLSAATGAVRVASVSSNAVATRADARATVAAFFRSINERRYDRTCVLLSAGYYRRHRLRSSAQCALGLRIGFVWSNEIRFRITGVRIDGSRAVVEALADGVPGRLVLVSEHGRLKVLSVLGS